MTIITHGGCPNENNIKALEQGRVVYCAGADTGIDMHRAKCT
jgi:hypothetical protein